MDFIEVLGKVSTATNGGPIFQYLDEGDPPNMYFVEPTLSASRNQVVELATDCSM